MTRRDSFHSGRSTQLIDEFHLRLKKQRGF